TSVTSTKGLIPSNRTRATLQPALRGERDDYGQGTLLPEPAGCPGGGCCGRLSAAGGRRHLARPGSELTRNSITAPAGEGSGSELACDYVACAGWRTRFVRGRREDGCAWRGHHQCRRPDQGQDHSIR